MSGSDDASQHGFTAPGDILQATKSQPVRKTVKNGSKVMWKLKKGDVVVVAESKGKQIKVSLRDSSQQAGWVDGSAGLVAVESATDAEQTGIAAAMLNDDVAV